MECPHCHMKCSPYNTKRGDRRVAGLRCPTCQRNYGEKIVEFAGVPAQKGPKKKHWTD